MARFDLDIRIILDGDGTTASRMARKQSRRPRIDASSMDGDSHIIGAEVGTLELDRPLSWPFETSSRVQITEVGGDTYPALVKSSTVLDLDTGTLG